LIAEERAKETGDSLTKRLEITAAMCFNFALLYLAPCCSAGPATASPPTLTSNFFEKPDTVREVTKYQKIEISFLFLFSLIWHTRANVQPAAEHYKDPSVQFVS
jgi:hypothetical protein